MNKTRYSATEFGRNKPMNFRPSGTLRPEIKATTNDEKYLSLINAGPQITITFCHIFRLNTLQDTAITLAVAI